MVVVEKGDIVVRTLNYTIEQVEALPLNEKLVVKAFYWEGKTLATIGKELGVGSERVSQIKRKALRRLALGNPHHRKVELVDILKKQNRVWLVREQISYEDAIYWSGVEVFSSEELALNKIRIKKLAWLLDTIEIDEPAEVLGTSSENKKVSIHIWVQPEPVISR